MKDHVVFFSGGIASWATAKRVAEKHGTKNLKLLFTDTKMEDDDLYRFLDEGAENVGGELIKIADGRTPWEVFKDVRLLGNSRLDPCSRILKREMATNWVKEHYPDPNDVVLYIGMDCLEDHRWKRSRQFWLPYEVLAPLMEKPFLMKDDMFEWLNKEGIETPRLYKQGYAHNNCGGFCIKSGAKQFRLLLRTNPERYAYHEQKEEEMRQFLDKDVSILRYQEDNERKNITLKQLRERTDKQCEMFTEDGGCGCFSTFDDDEMDGQDNEKGNKQ